MKTEEEVRKSQRETDWGKILVRYGFEPYDTESSARRVADFAASDIKDLYQTLKEASDHLEYCGYGDSWERECAKEAGLEIKVTGTLSKFENLFDD